MGIKSTQTISRADAITRIKYILSLVRFEDIEELLTTLDFEGDDLNMSEVDRMLGNVMDEELFRFSRFDNYIIEN